MSWNLKELGRSWAGESKLDAGSTGRRWLDIEPAIMPSHLFNAYRSNTYTKSLERGSEYLEAVRCLALMPSMVDVIEDRGLHDRLCAWIGMYIDAINAELQACLELCHACFHPPERRSIQILATPLARRFGVDGLCNIESDPIAILIDVGRVAPSDWLKLVAHEYAHAHLGSPGHDRRFLAILEHLCLGLGLQPPSFPSEISGSEMAAKLQNWPDCRSLPDPLAFWMGKQ
jgi:hypothetical protein